MKSNKGTHASAVSFESILPQIDRQTAVLPKQLCVFPIDSRLSRLPSPYKGDMYVMLLLLSGQAEGMIENIRYRAAAPALIFFPPNAFVEQQQCSEDTQAIVSIFSPEFVSGLNMPELDEFSRSVVFQPVLNLSEQQAALLREGLETIYHAVGANMPCAADFARHQIAALFYHPAMQTLTTGGNKIMRSPLVEQFMNLLREHYITETAVAFYSERLHISEAHLSRIVKQETEMTVLQWINSFRIKHAKQLLRYTRMNMSEIAFDLHFTSAEYFRYFFRRETGMSPIAYRNS